MPSTPEDRLFGITTSAAVKPAVAISADYHITTFGEQTITSSTMTGDRTITTTQNMRVLLMNQSDKRDNGIWLAGPVTWRRAPDFDGARDVVNGTIVFSIYGDCWQVEGTNPIRIGYDEITFRSTYPFSGDLNLYQRTIRAPDPFVAPLPPIAQLEGKILAVSGGKPIGVLPESGSAADVLIQLAATSGAGLVVGTSGNTVQTEINDIKADLVDISTNGASKLSTPRNINGVPFDGTANITITAQASGGNSATATKLQTPRLIGGASFDGTADVNPLGTRVWVSSEIIPTVATAMSVTHELVGIAPLKCKCDVLVKCVVAQGGYVAGDYGLGPMTGYSSTSERYSLTPVLTTTDISLALSTILVIIGKTSMVPFAATPANWRIIIRIFY